jgi:serine/threonine protein phosphatase 1
MAAELVTRESRDQADSALSDTNLLAPSGSPGADCSACARTFRLARGERAYAIGDVHGRQDLLEELLSLIQQDNASRPAARTKIIILGDIVDRGPQSADVVDRLMRYARSNARFIVLKGNHEQVMLAALAGQTQAINAWLRLGGAATLRSWGVPEPMLQDAVPRVLVREALQRIPKAVLKWMGRCPISHLSGDIFFVHAGIRPGIEIAKQKPTDMMWIRDDFLQCQALHPKRIVHGHSILERGPDVRPNRIGIDTGAYRTGRLTALGLEDDEHWILST